jgi:hypothetical protein
VLFADTEIDHFTVDAIDVGTSYFSLLRNRLHDPVVINGNHTDFVQGFGGGASPTVCSYSHGVIDSNTLTRQLDATNTFADSSQGIDAFECQWQDIAITRNIVVTESAWGISWGSTQGLLIAANTIIWDGHTSADGLFKPWIAAQQPSLNYPVGDHIVVVNNIAPSYLDLPLTSAGSVAAGNVTITDPYNGVFVSPTGNLHLDSGSPAVAAGVPAIPAPGDLSGYPDLTLPKTDIEGRAYDAASPAAGAYTYP